MGESGSKWWSVVFACMVMLFAACTPDGARSGATAAASSSAPSESVAGSAPAAGAAIPSTAAAASPVALKPLKIAVPNHSTSQLHVYATRNLGIYEQYGFDADIAFIPNASTGMAAL